MILHPEALEPDCGKIGLQRTGSRTMAGTAFVVGSAILLVASEIFAALGVLVWAAGGMLGIGAGMEVGLFAVLGAPALFWLARFGRDAWRNETASPDLQD